MRERHVGHFAHFLDWKFLILIVYEPLKTEIIYFFPTRYFIDLSKEFSVYNIKDVLGNSAEGLGTNQDLP